MGAIKVTRKKVQIDTGIELDCVEVGAGTDVLFLHGYGDSWYSFSGLFPFLPDGIHAIVPSQRGHGESEKPASGYGIAQYAADAIALMDQLNIENAPVVGHSMGSFVATEMAINHPHRVAHLVLVAAATAVDTSALRDFIAETKSLTDPVSYDFVHELQSSCCIGPPGGGMTLDTIVQESLKVPAHVWKQALEGLVNHDRTAELHRISCPTTIFWGDEDVLFKATEQRKLEDRIGKSRLIVYDGVGHGLQWEKPERFVGDLMSSLAD